MDQLLADPAHRRELGLRGYQTFRERWTAEAHLKRYLPLIQDIASSRRLSLGG
jgi:hypothetical protein